MAYYPRHCQVMKKGICQKCYCSHEFHEIVRYENYIKKTETVNEAIFAKLATLVEASPTLDRNEAIELLEGELNELKVKSEVYKMEQEIIIRNIAKLRVFQIEHSLVGGSQQHDSIMEHFDKAVTATAILDGVEGRAIRDTLLQLQNDYKCAVSVEKLHNSKQPLTTVFKVVDALCMLPHCGDQLKEAINQIDKANQTSRQQSVQLQLLPSASSVGSFISNYFQET